METKTIRRARSRLSRLTETGLYRPRSIRRAAQRLYRLQSEQAAREVKGDIEIVVGPTETA